jgi:hypothetical protein
VIVDGAFRNCKELAVLEFSEKGQLKHIGNNAFRRCKSLQHITIPSSVETIADFAFGYCTKLLNVTLNDGTKCLNNSAFEGCTLLKQIVIPATVDTIGHCAFRNCNKLVNVILNEGLKYIGNQSFEGCTSLKQIEIPTTVEIIGNGAFCNCRELVVVKLNEGLEHIWEQTFEDCESLTQIENPSTVGIIGIGSFCNCRELVNVKLNEGLEYIGANAFEGTSIERIAIPSTVIDIDINAFLSCKKLEVEFCDEFEEFVHKTSLQNWWSAKYSNARVGTISHIRFVNSMSMFNFLSQRSIPERFDALKVKTWQLNICDMLQWSADYNAVESQLAAYERLMEVASLLELALWKSKIEEHSESISAMRSQHRIACGADVIIPNVLPYLLPN